MNINTIHREAMDLAEAAFNEKIHGNYERAAKLTREAFDRENKAAYLLVNEVGAEPTRSILFRSAASLALECGDFREAEKLIATALAGNPPENIANELRDLLEQVYFSRHLDLKGVHLDDDEIQMSINGESIGLGIASSEEVVNRVHYTELLIFRTAERKKGLPFREKGQTTKAIKEEFGLYMSVPRAASFAVTLKIGRPKDQMSLPFGPVKEVIDEVLDCLDFLNNKDEKTLKEKIPDNAYYQNFLGLAKQIAPDGKEVSQVGFTVLRNGAERRIPLKRERDKISLTEEKITPIEAEEKISIKGSLLYADSVTQNKKIKLVELNNQTHTILVPEGMMSDIVRPLWEDVVIVEGIKVGKEIKLLDIKKAEE